MSNTVSPPAAGSPAAIGDVLDTILPSPMGGGRGISRIQGPLHKAVYRILGSSRHPKTVWDIKQALKRSPNSWYRAVDVGAVRRCLTDGMTAGIVEFVGCGYQLRKGGR